MTTGTPSAVMRKTSDVMVEALENEGIEYIFGIPGEENLDLLDSLKTSSIKLVVTRHEQAAGFMAATVGRLTGKVGVCLSTLGPGATNFATAAAYAQLAGFAMMMITGQKPIRKSKQGSFQIVDIVENMRPITKFTKQIADGDLVPSLVREAIRVSEEEKPGAVHLELPEDIAEQKTDAPIFPVHPVRRPIAEQKAIRKAVEMIEAAETPLLLIGAGANRKLTQKMLRELVDELSIPFITTQMGKGVVSEAHPLYLGCCALSAKDYEHVCIEKADLIIMVGHDVVEKPPFLMSHGKPPMVIHIHFYTAKVDNVYFPHLEVVGDIANAIWQLKGRITKQSHWDYSFIHKVKKELEAHQLIGTTDSRFPLMPQRIVSDLRKAMPDDGIVCLDNGMYKIWFARCYKAYEPNTLLLDNALATMGAGLPSAMAAALLYPDRKVVAVCGDGGFMMNSQEMETAVRLNLNLTVIVINDNAYGMIKWKQNAAHFERFGLELKNPDFVAYANSYGAKGYRVTEADGFSQILHECLHVSKTGVKLIEVPVDYTWANTILDKELPGIIKNMMPKAPRISIALSEATAIPPTPRGFQGPTFNEGSQSGSQDSLKKMSLPEEKPEAADGAPESNEVIGEATPDDVDVSVREEPEITHGTPYLSASSGESVPVDPSESTSIDLAADATVNQEELEIRSYPMYIANKAVRPNSELQVTNKYTSKVVARCALAGAADIDAAIAAAERAMPAMNAMASYERKAVLEKVVLEVKERFEEFAHALCVEAGKPISCVTPSNDDLERVVPPCYWEISSNKDTNFLPIEAGSSGS